VEKNLMKIISSLTLREKHRLKAGMQIQDAEKKISFYLRERR
jgi:hypothetical protein